MPNFAEKGEPVLPDREHFGVANLARLCLLNELSYGGDEPILHAHPDDARACVLVRFLHLLDLEAVFDGGAQRLFD